MIPGLARAKTSLTLSSNTSGYELVILQFDGSNFRIVYTTPLTASVNGMALNLNDGDAAFKKGKLITNRFDLLSEFDITAKDARHSGLRISAEPM